MPTGYFDTTVGQTGDHLIQTELIARILPVAMDHTGGAKVLGTLAEIYTVVGEYDLAIDHLEYLLSIPGPLSVFRLRVDPRWDPLRDHTRFQALVNPQGA